jgi:transposase
VSVHQAAPVTSSTIVVAVDVGKCSAVLSVTNGQRCRLLGPIGFALTCSGMSAAIVEFRSVIESCAQVKVAVEAAGHYHRPVLDYRWPPGWEVLELNPAHVAEQRRVAGRRRLKTDAIDLEAITELVLAGRGQPAGATPQLLGEIGAGGAHRQRRIAVRAATKSSTAPSPG